MTGFFFSRQSFQNHDEVLEAKEAAAAAGGVEDRRLLHGSLRRRRVRREVRRKRNECNEQPWRGERKEIVTCATPSSITINLGLSSAGGSNFVTPGHFWPIFAN